MSLNDQRGYGCPSGQPAGAGEAVGAEFADDDVVEEFDAEDFAGFARSVSHLGVFHAGGWVARRMIVDQDDGRGVGEDRCFIEFTRMGAGLIKGANGYHVHADNDVLRVEHDRNEFLTVGFEELVAQDRNDVIGIVNRFAGLDFERPFADQFDAINRDVLFGRRPLGLAGRDWVRRHVVDRAGFGGLEE